MSVKNRIYKKKGIWYFDDYFSYITSITDLIPKDVVSFIANPKFYLLGSDSLYDAIVDRFELTYNKKSHLPILSIKFIGAYEHNYIFRFGDIKNIVFPNDSDGLFDNELLIHQFHIRKNGIFQYEFLFSNNAKIKILFGKISIKVETK